MVSPKDISIFITLAEVIKENYKEEEEEGKKKAFAITWIHIHIC